MSKDAPITAGTVPTKYWHALDNGRIQCDLCPRFCKLLEGQRGLCFVRARENDRIVLTTWGRSSGFCVDPIEKKPLNHFLPGTPVLSFGTAGCNLACKFCQNWDISKSRELDTLADQATPETIAAAARRLGCASVAFTYNDPVIFLEYAVDVARGLPRDRHPDGGGDRRRDLPGAAGRLLPPHGRRQRRPQGVHGGVLPARSAAASSAPVLDTLKYLKHETDVWFEITTLLIPGENDSDRELDEMTRWVAAELGPDVPIHFTAFHPDYKMLDLPPTPPATLARARRIALANGLRYAYTGNVHDEEGGSTVCHGCGERLVGRDWFVLTEWNLTPDGACATCGTPCAGRFAGAPGTWGSRRLPVRLRDFAAAAEAGRVTA